MRNIFNCLDAARKNICKEDESIVFYDFVSTHRVLLSSRCDIVVAKELFIIDNIEIESDGKERLHGLRIHGKHRPFFVDGLADKQKKQGIVDEGRRRSRSESGVASRRSNDRKKPFLSRAGTKGRYLERSCLFASLLPSPVVPFYLCGFVATRKSRTNRRVKSVRAFFSSSASLFSLFPSLFSVTPPSTLLSSRLNKTTRVLLPLFSPPATEEVHKYLMRVMKCHTTGARPPLRSDSNGNER